MKNIQGTGLLLSDIIEDFYNTIPKEGYVFNPRYVLSEMCRLEYLSLANSLPLIVANQDLEFTEGKVKYSLPMNCLNVVKVIGHNDSDVSGTELKPSNTLPTSIITPNQNPNGYSVSEDGLNLIVNDSFNKENINVYFNINPFSTQKTVISFENSEPTITLDSVSYNAVSKIENFGGVISQSGKTIKIEGGDTTITYVDSSTTKIKKFVGKTITVNYTALVDFSYEMEDFYNSSDIIIPFDMEDVLRASMIWRSMSNNRKIYASEKRTAQKEYKRVRANFRRKRLNISLSDLKTMLS